MVTRADQVSAEFFAAFKEKLASRRKSTQPVLAAADFAFLIGAAIGIPTSGPALATDQLDMIRRVVGTYIRTD